MNIVQFMVELMKRTKANAVNLRVAEYEHGAGLHVFVGESVMSFDCEVGDFDNLQTLLDGIDTLLNEREQQNAIAEVNATVEALKREGKL